MTTFVPLSGTQHRHPTCNPISIQAHRISKRLRLISQSLLIPSAPGMQRKKDRSQQRSLTKDSNFKRTQERQLGDVVGYQAPVHALMLLGHALDS
jgi:hypothetical protein